MEILNLRVMGKILKNLTNGTNVYLKMGGVNTKIAEILETHF